MFMHISKCVSLYMLLIIFAYPVNIFLFINFLFGYVDFFVFWLHTQIINSNKKS
uniref:Uncharacterized protein n=1 Tax=Glossina morsitans morsitans TaxID=37546 RepID=A0A1B0GDB8_GLOMM